MPPALSSHYAAMKSSEPSFEPWLLAVTALLVGPTAAFLHEADVLGIGPSGSLWPIGFVAVAAAAGFSMGLRLRKGGIRALGAIASLVNAIVLAYYGFFLLFFGLGGSR